MNYPVETDTGGGERLRLLGPRRDADGEYLAVEGIVDEAGVGPPMHVHFFQEERLRVKEGRLAYVIDGQETRYAGVGDEVVFRPGEMHRFWNAGDGPMRAEGLVRPVDNCPWFITRLHESIRQNGGARPGFFEGAFLMHHFRTEFDMKEIPVPVKRFVFPVVVLLGRLLGRYRGYADAPAARRSA